MDDLVRWLGEQYDEDERIARRLLNDTRPGRAERWEFCDDGAIRDTGERRSLRVKFTWSPEAEHIVRHDPARVLREIDAKRQLIARGGPFCTSDCDEPGNEPMDPDTNWTTPLEHHLDCAAYEAAKLIALPYADRPGYKEKWRP